MNSLAVRLLPQLHKDSGSSCSSRSISVQPMLDMFDAVEFSVEEEEIAPGNLVPSEASVLIEVSDHRYIIGSSGSAVTGHNSRALKCMTAPFCFTFCPNISREPCSYDKNAQSLCFYSVGGS